jgi:co-chaperonin GroES (HSP10)
MPFDLNVTKDFRVQDYVPMGTRVLLENGPETLRGAPLDSTIIVPGKYAETPQTAKVVAMSPQAMQLLPEVKVGDTVFCQRYPQSAWSFKHEGRELVSVKAEDILLRMR